MQNKNSYINSPIKTTKISATSYQPNINKIEVVKPKSKIFKLYLKQDEFVKEGIKTAQSVDSIKLKIEELKKVIGRQM